MTVFQPEGRCFCHHDGCVLEQNHTGLPDCARALLLGTRTEEQDVGPKATAIMSGVFIVFVVLL